MPLADGAALGALAADPEGAALADAAVAVPPPLALDELAPDDPELDPWLGGALEAFAEAEPCAASLASGQPVSTEMRESEIDRATTDRIDMVFSSFARRARRVFEERGHRERPS